MWRKLSLISLGALAVAGCATRGSIAISCQGFDGYVKPLPVSRLVRDIQADTVTEIELYPAKERGRASRETAPGPLEASIAELVRNRKDGPEALHDGSGAMLLLSGGGQWGAFGAGYLSTLAEDGGSASPNVQILTGVSTGAMQSLFIAIDDKAAYDALKQAYLPASEKEIVNRNSPALSVVTGSVAGLKPLRRRIEAALCKPEDKGRCALIEALATSTRQVFVGFVEARTGEFVYADVNAIARSGTRREATVEDRRNAQQCLTGVALASAAMPVFFQRVTINDRTYYDGGVRQSVFEAGITESVELALAAVAAEREEKGDTRPAVAPPLYVVRNGPTQLLGKGGIPDIDPSADAKADALTAAFRAEAIVVNQLEVGSIAALRLSHPKGPIHLVTADGYHKDFALNDGSGGKHKACVKKPDIMFDPEFMLCLQAFGRSKALRPNPWLTIGELELRKDEAAIKR